MYERFLNMFPMTYEKWCNLNEEDKREWKEAWDYIQGYLSVHILRVYNCLNGLDSLELRAKENSKGYKRSKIEILVKKYMSIFGIQKVKGLYKQIDALRWKVRSTVPLFNWNYENIIADMERDLFNLYCYEK